MALAIDASTPAYVSTLNTSVATLTTASFTPPSGALLVVGFVNGFSRTMNQPTNSGGTVSWNAAVTITATQNGVAALWLGKVTSSASMTVSETPSSASSAWGIGVAVVTGQAASPVGVTNSSTGAPAAPSVTLTNLTGSNSLILGVCNNGSNGTVPAAGTNQSQSFNGNAFSFSDTVDASSGWMQYDTRINLAAGSNDTLNNSGAVNNAFVAIEVLASTGAVNPAYAPPILSPRSSYF